MVVYHTRGDLKEGVHLFISVADCSRWVWAEARFMRINSYGVTLLDSCELIVDIVTEVHLGNKA